MGARHAPSQVWNQPGHRVHPHVGVAELQDYDWYFTDFTGGSATQQVAQSLGIELGDAVVYFPAGLTTCGIPAISSSRLTPAAGATRAETASFLFQSERSTPIRTDSSAHTEQRNGRNGPNLAISSCSETCRNSPGPGSFTTYVGQSPITEASRRTRSKSCRRSFMPRTRSGTTPTQRGYDPHSVAWVARDDLRDSPLPLRRDRYLPKP